MGRLGNLVRQTEQIGLTKINNKMSKDLIELEEKYGAHNYHP